MAQPESPDGQPCSPRTNFLRLRTYQVTGCFAHASEDSCSRPDPLGNIEEPFRKTSETMSEETPRRTRNGDFVFDERTPETGEDQRLAGTFNILLRAVSSPRIFHDERDRILEHFNRVQARFGFGKVFFSQSGNPAEILPNNPYCVFKSIIYKKFPDCDPSDGLVCLIVDRHIDQLRNKESSFIRKLNRRLVRDPNVRIMLDSMEDLGENLTRISIYVNREKSEGKNQRFTTADLKRALLQDEVKPTLERLNIVDVKDAAELHQNRIEELRTRPPLGINKGLWEAAKVENPDPSKYFPDQILGFEGLNRRALALFQELDEQETELLQLSVEVGKLEKHCCQLRETSRTLQLHQEEMEDRVLKVLSVFAVAKNRGQPICSEERSLKESMETILDRVKDLNEHTLNRLEEKICSMRESGTMLTSENKNMLINQTKRMESLAMKVKRDLRVLEEIEELHLRTSAGRRL